MRFSELDNCTVAVVFRIDQSHRVVVGKAHYERRDDLGAVLNVVVDDESGEQGRPEILIPESSWKGQIAADRQHGCDYCLTMHPTASQVVQ